MMTKIEYLDCSSKKAEKKKDIFLIGIIITCMIIIAFEIFIKEISKNTPTSKRSESRR